MQRDYTIRALYSDLRNPEGTTHTAVAFNRRNDSHLFFSDEKVRNSEALKIAIEDLDHKLKSDPHFVPATVENINLIDVVITY